MLDTRLQAILQLIQPCGILADVGTDHAYIPYEALKTGLCTFAYAADIKAGPLKHAQATFGGTALEDKVRLIVCDGIQSIPDPLDAVVIAGMGAETALPIIQNDIERFKEIPQIIIQVNRDVARVRKTMNKLGFSIVDETISFLRHYYVAIKFQYDASFCEYSDIQLKYGPVLLQKREPILLDYLHSRIEQLQSLSKHITDVSKRSAFIAEALEIRNYLDKGS
jgi:tRNA (adenine22-N1)-methyltransferase